MCFIVIDVETANPNFSSICQVGIAVFREGKLADQWACLVNPQDYFDDINVSIHGISEDDVSNAPHWPAVYTEVAKMVRNSIVVSHSRFDRSAITQACAKFSIQPEDWAWLDSTRVIRRAWPIFSKSGYGLGNVASHFGIEFRHHDAVEDARATGEILLRAISETGITIDEWLERVEKRIASDSPRRDGNSDGPLFGQRVVFTGTLSIARKHAADLAAGAGCAVDSGVTKETTLLVVGDQDIFKLGGNEKSTKHRKAESLIKSGQSIRIVGESDFLRLVGCNVTTSQ